LFLYTASFVAVSGAMLQLQIMVWRSFLPALQ